MSRDAGPGPRVVEILELLDAWYPPRLAESWDVVGLTVGSPTSPVTSIRLAVEPTAAVIAETASAGADLLITHHPLLLRGIDRVRFDTPKGELIEALIRHGITLVVAHTNADAAPGGVVDCLADALGLLDRRPLVPALGPGAGPELDAPRPEPEPAVTRPEPEPAVTRPEPEPAVTRPEPVEGPRPTPDPVEGPLPTPHSEPGPAQGSQQGLGRVGRLAEVVTLGAFADRVSAALPPTAAGIRIGGDPDRVVRRVAVLAGAGDSLLDVARGSGADVYVTSDLRHHPASDTLAWADAPALIDIPHWAAEWLWLPRLRDQLEHALQRRGHSLPITVSTIVTDPWVLRRP